MNRQEIIEFLNANPLCHLATAEDGQPHVRGMMMYKADETGLLFHTGAFKALYSQIQKNGRIEICFNSPDMQVRVMGIAEIFDNPDLKREIVEARPFLKSLIEQRGFDVLTVFRVKECKAAVWTMATNQEPTSYMPI